MEFLSKLIESVAWPVATIFLGVLVLRELKSGLIERLMPNGGKFRGPGFEFEANANFQRQTSAASEAARKAKVVVVAHEAASDLNDDLTPYDRVIVSWRELAAAFTARAVSIGGVDDKRRINQNLQVMRDRGAFDEHVLASVSDLFQARNSVRKLGPQSIAEADAETFVETANALAQLFLGK